MDSKKLTKRQQQVLDFVREQTAKNGYPPTVREIGHALGLSSSATVHTHLNTLEAKGYIRRDGMKSRSVTVVEDDGLVPAQRESIKHIDKTLRDDDEMAYAMRNSVSLPLVGRVAAGSPILAEQNIEEQFVLPKEIVGDTSSFLLRVQGESMIEAGILPGDYVVVREQSSASNGNIVVAMLDGEATVKSYYKEDDCIRLQPHNPAMEPIYTRDAVILGVVVALFRSL